MNAITNTQNLHYSDLVSDPKRTKRSSLEPDGLGNQNESSAPSATRQKTIESVEDWVSALKNADSMGERQRENEIYRFCLFASSDKTTQVFTQIFPHCPNTRNKILAELEIFQPHLAFDRTQVLEILSCIEHTGRSDARVLELFVKNQRPALTKADVNLLTQKIAARSLNYPLRQHDDLLFNWLLKLENTPDPFSWAQAVQKCVDNGDANRVQTLWNMTKGAHLSPAALPMHWRNLMKTKFDAHNATLIRLLPFFFHYHLVNSSLGENPPDHLKYIDQMNEAWLEAIPTENEFVLNELVTPRFLDQIDVKTKFQGFRTLIRNESFEAGYTLLKHIISKLSVDQINQLIPGCANRPADYSKTEIHAKIFGLLSSESRRREAEEMSFSTILT